MDKKRITTLFLIVLADMMGGSAIIPILPVFVVGQFHASPLQATLVIAVFYVAQVLASPVLGNLSDRFGRRPLLLISQAGTIVSYLFIVLAVPLGAFLAPALLPMGIARGLIVIYLARLLDGATGGNISVALAYASDVSTPEERTRVMGVIGGASGVGHILGPALAGLLAVISLLTPFWGAVVISGVTLLLTLLWLREPLKHAEVVDKEKKKQERIPLSSLLRSRPVVLILSMVLLMGLFMAALFGTLGLYTNRVLLGSTLLVVSAVGFFAFTSLWAFIAFLIVFAFGTGIISPTLQSLLTRSGPEKMAGQLLGWYQSIFSLALILGPLLGGLLFQAVAPQAIFAGSAGLMVLTLFLSIGIQRLPQTAFPQNTPEERVPMHH